LLSGKKEAKSAFDALVSATKTAKNLIKPAALPKQSVTAFPPGFEEPLRRFVSF
jgi:hypothetical protein